jgi:hypothetical protein
MLVLCLQPSVNDQGNTTQKEKVAFFKRISDSFLSDISQENCRLLLIITPLVFSSIFAILNVFEFEKKWLLIIIITIVALIQGFVATLFWYKLKSISSYNNEEIERLQRLNSELVKTLENNSYQRCISVELLAIIDALQEMKTSHNIKAFYTKLLYSIMEMSKTVANVPNENLVFHLYLYDSSQKTVGRVAAICSVKTLQTPEEKAAVPIKKVKNYFYAKCLASRNKTLFYLPDNQAIRGELDFKNTDESIIRQFTQYMAISYYGKGVFKFLVEIISFNGVNIYSDPEIFAEKVVTPFSSVLKLIEIESA